MTPFYNMVKLGFLQNIYATTPHYITNSPKRHYQRKNAKSIPKYVLVWLTLKFSYWETFLANLSETFPCFHILFHRNNARDLIEFAQTKPLKIHGLSGFHPRFAVGPGKCVFGYEDGKNKRNRWYIWISHL